MCLALYIGSEQPLHTTAPWSPAVPRFHVIEPEDIPAPVRSQLGTRYIYYAGAHEGCGCGFSYESERAISEQQLPPDMMESELQDREVRRMSVKSLRDYLALAVRSHSVRLLVTWMDDEQVPLKRHYQATADSFNGDSWSFEAHELIDILQGT